MTKKITNNDRRVAFQNQWPNTIIHASKSTHTSGRGPLATTTNRLTLVCTECHETPPFEGHAIVQAEIVGGDHLPTAHANANN